MGLILFFSIGIPLLCLPAYIVIEMTKPKEERWGRSSKSSSEGLRFGVDEESADSLFCIRRVGNHSGILPILEP